MNYLIAVCDILGFSKLFGEMTSNKLDKIVGEYVGYVKRSLWFAADTNQKLFPDDNPSLAVLRMNVNLGIALFSDTILLYTKEDTESNCLQLLRTVGELIGLNMKSPKTRLRVGISYGEAWMDEQNETYIGKPIVEAYQLEKKQKWSGGALTKKAKKRFGSFLAKLNPIQSFVVPYEVPMGKDYSEKLLAINWTVVPHSFNSLGKFYWKENNPEPTIKECLEQPDIVEKWWNTKEFHAKNCWRCFPKSNPKIIKPPGNF